MSSARLAATGIQKGGGDLSTTQLSHWLCQIEVARGAPGRAQAESIKLVAQALRKGLRHQPETALSSNLLLKVCYLRREPVELELLPKCDKIR